MDDAEKAFAYAVRVLACRDHSHAELGRKLHDRGIPADIAERVMARLTASGYLDDRRFAERWAESAVRNGRGYGRRLDLELARRGVSREIAADVVSRVSAAYDEEETLAALVSRKFASFEARTASDRDTRRIVSYLQRRGFSTAAIFRILSARDASRE